MTTQRLNELASNLASSIAGKEPQDVEHLCKTFIEMAVKEEEKETITITMAQTLLDCSDYGVNGRQIVRGCAHDAGLMPLSKRDRSVLIKGMGRERFERFAKFLTP